MDVAFALRHVLLELQDWSQELLATLRKQQPDRLGRLPWLAFWHRRLDMTPRLAVEPFYLHSSWV